MISFSRIVAGVAVGFLMLMTLLAALGWVGSLLEKMHA
jgi:hypothetical protein